MLLHLLEEDRTLRAEAEQGQSTKNYMASDPGKFIGEWKEDLPTVCSFNHSNGNCSAKNVWSALKTTQPLIDVPSVQDGTFIVAGGSVSHALAGKLSANSEVDIDLFYSGSADDASYQLRKLLLQIDEAFVRRNIWDALTMYKKLLVDYVSSITTTETSDEETQKYEIDVDVYLERLMTKWSHGQDVPEFLSSTSVYGRVMFEKYPPNGSVCHSSNNSIVPTPPQGLSKSKWTEFLDKKMGEFTMKYDLNPKYEILRTKNAVSVHPKNCGPPIQVILRVYKKVEHITLGFDLGSSACALILDKESASSSETLYPEQEIATDGPFIQFSPVGWFSHLTRYNVVDTTRLSTTFSHRLFKYAERGFGFILPHLNLGELPRENLSHGLPQYLDLPNLPLIVERLVGQNLQIRKKSDRDLPYDAFGDYSLEEMSHSRVVSQNIRSLITGSDNFVFQASFEKNILKVVDGEPKITSHDLSQRFDNMTKAIWHKERLNFKAFELHLNAPPELEEDMPVWDKGYAKPPKLPTMTIEEFTAIEKNQRGAGEQAIRELLAQRRYTLLDAWENVPADHKTISWLTNHPCSQEKNYLFTGSMRPLYISAEDWYGRYYRQVE